jgi:hypothetical protein
MQVAEQGFVQVNGRAAAATDQVMMSMPFGSFIMGLLAWQMIFAD